jgi:hypothetical protein
MWGLFQNAEECGSVGEYVNVALHNNRPRERNEMTIFIDAEKAFSKIECVHHTSIHP